MRKRFFGFCAAALLAIGANSAQAVIISLDPASQSVAAGDSVEVAVILSGLPSPGAQSLAGFSLDVSFDSAILDFSKVVFGDPVLGDQLDLGGLSPLTDVFSYLNGVNIFELSFSPEADLNAGQAGAFTLATLTFEALKLGTTTLTPFLDPFFGALLDAGTPPAPISVNDFVSAEVRVATTVPAPATLLLLAGGLFGLGFARRRQRVF